VSELGDVLELLHGAHRRYRTVRLVAHEWRHDARFLAAYEQAMRAGGASGYESAQDEGVPAETDVVVRAWFEQPNRFREEREDGGRLYVAASNGSRWWTALPDWATIAEDGDGWLRGHVGRGIRQLLDPARLVGVVDLEPRARGEVAGRPAYAVTATPRPGVYPDVDVLATGADRHELLVDAERGLLLAATSSRSGEPFSSIRVDEIAFDEPIDAARFAYEPKPGEPVLGLHESAGEHVSIEEAARRASFTVLVPGELGRGWQMHVLHTQGADGSQLRETVSLTLYREDATHTIAIRQTAPPFERWQLNGTERVDRGGRELRVSGEGWRRVLLEHSGTALEISSSSVETDELVELALALAPAPTELPPLLA
jgi:outer membrane lipoprotein-sorting protein